jgi:hypothetical protein
MLKLGYLFILDSVDNSGVWEADFELADFQVGAKIEWEELKLALGDRVEVLDDGKWHMRRFVKFQYGELSPASKPHAQVLRLREAHGITASKGYRESTHTLKDKNQEEVKAKDIGGLGEIAEEIYQVYPRKVAKPAAITAILKALDGDIAKRGSLLAKTRAYAEAVSHWPADERQFVPHPATWFNQRRYDDDPTAWARENTTDTNSDNKGGSGQALILSVASAATPVPHALNTPEFHAAWTCWTAYCAEQRWAPYTPQGLAAQYAELATWGVNGAIAAIKESIRNGYKGLFNKPKPKFAGTKTTGSLEPRFAEAWDKA